jgi:bifunctional non-homologous end joining protein LigD
MSRGRAVELTHLDRMFWPEAGLRKRDLVDYYHAVSPLLLPHLRGRPFTIKRHYTVPRGPSEWVKDAPPELPRWIKTCPQPAKSRGGALVRYPLVDSDAALLWIVDYGAIDLHVWTSRCDRPERPDYVLFDLDPAAGAAFADVVRTALLVREALDALALVSLVRTTGGDGLHVLVPIARRHTHEQARRFAGVVATARARAEPELVTTEPKPDRRRGVYVDVKMNGHGQQVVCGYSVRPLPGAPVATPLRWAELDETLDPASLNLRTVPPRLAKLGDLHDELLHGRQRLDRALAAVRPRRK